jgi:dipeptidyl aminopeptidase/acylaminoacyl peptidase
VAPAAASCFVQGDEDEIVPPEQSVLMWEAIKAKGLPTTLMMYKVRGWMNWRVVWSRTQE